MIPPAIARQLHCLEKILAENYRSTDNITAPSNIAQREFGFTSFNGGFRRHMSFVSSAAYTDYIKEFSPKDVYYSVARYLKPTVDMHNKGWIAADVPFDLDAEQVLRTNDELVTSGWITREKYDLIKHEFMRLLEDYVEADFGLGPNDYTLGFSGGRGYHMRINNSVFESLDQRARRRLVEYIAIGYRPARIFGFRPTSKFYPFTHDYGWCRRVYNWMRSASLDDFGGLGVGSKETVRRILENVKKAPGPRGFSVTALQYITFKKIFESAVSSTTVTIDERVTVDINRLLRAPGTVHGGSGLLCLPIERSAINSFDPFVHAVMSTKGRSKIRVMRLPIAVELNGEALGSGDQGKTVEINNALAYYVVVRRGGEFVESV